MTPHWSWVSTAVAEAAHGEQEKHGCIGYHIGQVFGFEVVAQHEAQALAGEGGHGVEFGQRQGNGGFPTLNQIFIIYFSQNIGANHQGKIATVLDVLDLRVG